MKWTADRNASPPIYHELREGKKLLATVRRVGGKRDRLGRWRYRYQAVTRFVDVLGGAVGPVFGTLAKAKAHAEAKAKAS